MVGLAAGGEDSQVLQEKGDFDVGGAGDVGDPDEPVAN